MIDEKTATQLSVATVVPDGSDDEIPTSDRPTYLIVVGGGPPGALLRLNPGTTRVGRAYENPVRFPDPSVSRRHATIVAGARGDTWLTDLGSTNGTFLNGERLAAQAPHRLEDGDRVRFGSSVLVKFVRLDPTDERFQRELFERAVRDPLTGLHNRAYFLEQIGPLAELCASKGLGLGVLMLDVDHFKRVNDGYGHPAGDAVLREVAAVLRESTRGDDLVARYGGEEFVAALPMAAPDQAVERAERIRDHLAARRVAVPGAPAGGIGVTASLGLAFARRGRVRSVAGLIAAADQCLYQAKDSGRNRVVLRVDPCGAAAELVTPYGDGV